MKASEVCSDIIPTPEQVDKMFHNLVMPKLSRSTISDEGIKLILGVPVKLVDGQPEPISSDVNGLKVIIEPDYRRIWMKAYFPFLSNMPGSGRWSCSSCRRTGDRFYMKGHRERGMCGGYNDELANTQKAQELIKKEKPAVQQPQMTW